MGAKVLSREGNSPDHRLRSLNLHPLRREWAPHGALRGRLGSCHPMFGALCGGPAGLGLRGVGEPEKPDPVLGAARLPIPNPTPGSRLGSPPGFVRPMGGTMEWVAGQIIPEESVVAQRPQGPISPNVIRESCGVPKSWNGGRGLGRNTGSPTGGPAGANMGDRPQCPTMGSSPPQGGGWRFSTTGHTSSGAPADTVGSGAFWLPLKGGARAPLEVPEVRMRA